MRGRTVVSWVAVAGLMLAAWGTIACGRAAAGEAKVAFLAADTSADAMGSEARAACKLAERLAGAALVLPAGHGRFVDAGGKEVPLADFQVVWHHQGDTIAQTGPLYDRETAAALKRYVEAGGGLFLSGAALAMVHTLGIETAAPRRGNGGTDGYQASLVAVEATHPVFDGFSFEGIFQGNKLVRITSGGWPAYADFLGSGGPARGMLLARADCGAENPLVEYQSGKGRVIVMGWRLPNYSLADNAYRENLQRLTGNILNYLGKPDGWQKVVIHRGEGPSPAARPGVRPEEFAALRRAVCDLRETFGERYGGAAGYLARLDALEESQRAILPAEPTADSASADKGLSADDLARLDALAEDFRALRREALAANPLLDFDRVLVVERRANNLGLPANWQSNSSLPTTGYDNRIALLSLADPDAELTTLYQPDGGRFVGDVDLDFDGRKLLFSMPGSNGRWQVFEMAVDGTGLRELPLIHEPDVDNYDACYLPDGRILFTSTAPFVGVPCVYGSSHVTNMYRLEADGSIRQLTVDQEHNWCPAVLNNGRVLYLRWEYTDLPHSNSRILFHMNPDGTGQMEYYGSNSFFTNSFFYARPIPGHPTKVVGIATGHHGVARAGRMLILDPAHGRREAEGMVQEIPGFGKPVKAIIRDNLVDGVWPQFLHPYPLSEKHFLVSCRPTPQSPWGIYLVDVFDNIVLLKETPGYALLEPIPLRKTPRPPVIADKVDPQRDDALVYMNDIYRGNGLKGIPRGTVKKLRVYSYHFSYRGMGGLLGAIGMDGPWDIRRVLGTVPVEPDGSALFRMPAYTPVAVQPLDADGKALQVMRSWFTAMPGEVLSCVGCHERQNDVTPNRDTTAARRPPSQIAPWYGPVRGFSFAREVQPVLDRYCVECHNGSPADDGRPLADLRGGEILTDWTSAIAGHVNPAVGGKFSRSYAELHRYVRRPGIESNIHLPSPMEYHADTTELVQILSKGHHNVRMDDEAWDRLITWIDMNAPYHGTWSEIAGEKTVRPLADRAQEMLRRYAGRDDDPEAIPPVATLTAPPVEPAEAGSPSADDLSSPDTAPKLAGWPFDAEEARRRQAADGDWQQTVDLGEGVTLELVRIPAGRFVMGDAAGRQDERPPSVVTVDKPFWIGRFEVTNEQFARFDPEHDSAVEPMHGYQFGIEGYPVRGPKQPVVRVSWNQAMAFCRWLSAKTGKRFTLPTEAQWEYACRAGTASPMWYGGLDTDFSKFANLGDARLSEFALDTYVRVRLVPNPNQYDDWVPKDPRFNDGGFVSVDVGRYAPNPWGLYDAHGNVWEWTRSLYRPYPYREDDGRNDAASAGRRVARGGSWYDRPKRCRSAFRLPYHPFQPVYNVGFRVAAADGSKQTWRASQAIRDESREQSRKTARRHQAHCAIPAQPTTVQQRAIAVIKDVDGKVTVDDKKPGRPVIGVDLFGLVGVDVVMPYLKAFPQLQTLNLTMSTATDAGLEHVTGLTQLRSLNLTNTCVTDGGLTHLEGLSELRSLDLTANRVTGAGLMHLQKLAKLESLCLYQTQMTDAAMAHLKGLGRLQHLTLTYTKVTDAGLIQLKDLTNLRTLRLSGTMISDGGLAHLKGLTNLQTLRLSGCNLTDAGLQHLKGLRNLRELDLSFNDITDTGLEQLKGLRNLRSLRLAQTKVSDAGIAHLKGLGQLRSLNLEQTDVTRAGVEELRRSLPNCEIVD